MTIGCSLDDSRNALAVAEQYDNVWATLGVHPHDAKDWDAATEAEFRQWPRAIKSSRSERSVSTSTGTSHPHADQYRAFEAQLALADELNLPVVIHSRDAHEETHGVLLKWANRGQRDHPIGVIHCFSGDADLAHRYHDLGFLISFAGPVTNDAQGGAASLPLSDRHRDGLPLSQPATPSGEAE